MILFGVTSIQAMFPGGGELMKEPEDMKAVIFTALVICVKEQADMFNQSDSAEDIAVRSFLTGALDSQMHELELRGDRATRAFHHHYESELAHIEFMRRFTLHDWQKEVHDTLAKAKASGECVVLISPLSWQGVELFFMQSINLKPLSFEEAKTMVLFSYNIAAARIPVLKRLYGRKCCIIM